ncbi:MAG: hypothetical protein WA843_03395 [Candidatus Saccharimonadales bacterium]
MAPEAAKAASLPVLISSPADVGRLIRELGNINDALLQLGVRTGGSEVRVPKTSQLMNQLVEQNKLNLLREADRAALAQFLQAVKDRAPVLHMSFSADPSAAFMGKLTAWLRQEIHPLALVTIGLQPTIGAGCIVRSTNKQFDFSLRQDFAKKRDLLTSKLMLEKAQT